jgi:hypothetical protein
MLNAKHAKRAKEINSLGFATPWQPRFNDAQREKVFAGFAAFAFDPR